MSEWQPDVLGAGFEQFTIDLGADDEGPLVATLVRSLPRHRSVGARLFLRPLPLENVDVLYIHGWSDYFFQRRLAGFWTDRGARFFALDLRKYGRSLRPNQTAGYVEHLEDYDAEIGEALALIRKSGVGERRLVLMGHSTGGLILSLWSSRNPGVADALVLNSPWLEFQLSSRIRQLIAPFVDLRARLQPMKEAPQLDAGFYSRAVREAADPDDPMDIDTAWRPDRSHAVTPGWLRAVLAGHAEVGAGLVVNTPICVLLSARSEAPLRWSENLTRADTVLDVDEVARASLKLGPSVTIERIDGALHDIFLSRREARNEAYARLDRWVVGWQAVPYPYRSPAS